MTPNKSTTVSIANKVAERKVTEGSAITWKQAGATVKSASAEAVDADK